MSIASLVKTAMNAVPSELKARVTFTRTTKTVDETTLLTSTSKTSIEGVAVRGEGDPDRYRALSLIESQAPSLWFVSDNAGELPSVGDEVVWAGVPYTVRDVDPVSPGGTGFGATVVVER